MTDTFADPPLYPLFQLGPNSKFHGKVWHLLGTRSSWTVNCSPSNTFRTGYSVNRWEHLEKSLWGNLACTHLYWFLCLRLAGCSPNSTWYTQCGILQYRPYSRHRSHHISVHQLRHILVKMVKSAGSCEKCLWMCSMCTFTVTSIVRFRVWNAPKKIQKMKWYEMLQTYPIGSMYAIYGNIYHHGSYGYWEANTQSLPIPHCLTHRPRKSKV